MDEVASDETVEWENVGTEAITASKNIYRSLTATAVPPKYIEIHPAQVIYKYGADLSHIELEFENKATSSQQQNQIENQVCGCKVVKKDATKISKRKEKRADENDEALIKRRLEQMLEQQWQPLADQWEKVDQKHKQQAKVLIMKSGKQYSTPTSHSSTNQSRQQLLLPSCIQAKLEEEATLVQQRIWVENITDGCEGGKMKVKEIMKRK